MNLFYMQLIEDSLDSLLHEENHEDDSTNLIKNIVSLHIIYQKNKYFIMLFGELCSCQSSTEFLDNISSSRKWTSNNKMVNGILKYILARFAVTVYFSVHIHRLLLIFHATPPTHIESHNLSYHSLK